MALSPLVPGVFVLVIGIAVFIRMRIHPRFPVITLFIMLSLLIAIGCLFMVDNALSYTNAGNMESPFFTFLMRLIVLGYRNATLDNMYNAYDQLKFSTILLIISANISLFIETGMVLRTKKERV